MDFNKKTFWMVFVISIVLICAIVGFIILKLVSLEEYLKDYVYQNEEYREEYSKSLESINDNLVKINNYFDDKKLTKN